MALKAPWTGGCSCGAVRYEITGKPYHVCHCHCRLCRGSTGAAMVTWLTVNKNDFNVTEGELRGFQSSEVGERCFCGKCGSHITFDHKNYDDEIDVTVASLDNSDRLPPGKHIWTDQSLSWARIDEHLPKRRRD